MNKLKHLEHIEDLIFDKDVGSTILTVELLEEIHNNLNGIRNTIKVQGKLDGAPSIIAGTCPETGKFFVATKSLFNKTPKINYTVADIQKNHSGRLAEKLRDALFYLPSVFPKGKIFQGDLLFSGADKYLKNINGIDSWVFTPNTLTYAVPITSKMGRDIAMSQIGIGWHTTYEGDSIKGLTAKYEINISGMKKSDIVWNIDTNIAIPSTWELSAKKYDKRIDKSILMLNLKLFSWLPNLMDNLDSLFSNPTVYSIIRMYINYMVKVGDSIPDTTSGVLDSINNFVDQKCEEKTASLKTDAAKEKHKANSQAIKAHFETNSNTLFLLFHIHEKISFIKNMLIKKLDHVKRFKVYLRTNDGYNITQEEGYVVIFKDRVVKLVNRKTFSNANFNMAKLWETNGKAVESDVQNLENSFNDVVNRVDSITGEISSITGDAEHKEEFDKVTKDLRDNLESLRTVINNMGLCD